MKVSRYFICILCALICNVAFAQLAHQSLPLMRVLMDYAEHASTSTLTGIESARLKQEWEDATRWRVPQVALNAGTNITQSNDNERLSRTPVRSNRLELLASMPIVNAEAKYNIDAAKASLESSIWAQSAELEATLLDFVNLLENIAAASERKVNAERLSANLDRLFEALQAQSAAGYTTPVARLELKVATMRLLRIQENAQFELTELQQRLRLRLRSDAEYARAVAAVSTPRPSLGLAPDWVDNCSTAMTPGIAKVMADMDLIKQRLGKNIARYAPKVTIDATLRDQRTIGSGRSVLSGEVGLNLAWQWLDSSLYRSLVQPNLQELQAAEKYLEELRTQRQISCTNNNLLFKRYSAELAHNAIERSTLRELSDLQTRRLKLGVQTTSLFELISNEFNAFDLNSQDIQTRLSLRRLEWEYMFQTRLIGVRNGKFFVG